jgi:hypothetical protein
MAGTTNLIEGVSGAANAYNQTQSLAMQGEFQQKMFERNQKLSDMQAADALRRGDVESGKVRRSVSALLGKQRTALAAQGIDINSGDAATIQRETSAFGALDELTVKTNAWREAYGFRMNSEISYMNSLLAKTANQTQIQSTALTGGLNFLKSAVKSGYYYGGGSSNLDGEMGGWAGGNSPGWAGGTA